MPSNNSTLGPIQENTKLVAKFYRILTNTYLNSNKEVNKLPEEESKKYKSDLDLICKTKLLLSTRTMQAYAQGKTSHNNNYLMTMDKFEILEQLVKPLIGVDFTLSNKELGFDINQELTDKFKLKFSRQKDLFNLDYSERNFDVSVFKDIFNN